MTNSVSNELNKELHRIAITVIIYKKEGDTLKYLVTKRAPHKIAHPNKWTVPGGGLNTDDYLHGPQDHGNAGWYNAVENALTREIKEEVGVQIKDPKYLLDLTFIRPDNIPVLVLSYYAAYVGGEVKLDEDNTEFAWISVIEGKSYDLIPGIYEELEMVEEKVK